MALPRKSWGELSKPYQKRMSKAGLNSRNWGTPKGAELRKAARGHAKTPEHPSEAARHPERFREYVSKQGDELRRVKARKEEIFGSAIRYKPFRSEANAKAAPLTGTTKARLMRKFLRMTSDEAHIQASALSLSIKGKNREQALRVIATDWSGDDWSFLFYH
jgi:hypothetical protein